MVNPSSEVTLSAPMMSVYRGPITNEKYTQIIKKPGLYDCVTKYNGDARYITDHDQIGFNLPHKSGNIHIDAAFDEMNDTYHIIGEIDDGKTTELSAFKVGDNKDPRKRSFLQNVMGQLYIKLSMEGLPVMAIKDELNNMLDKYNQFSNDYKVQAPSNN